MSNLLVQNMAAIFMLLRMRRFFWVLVEQPASSWLFKMNFMLSFATIAACVKVKTWRLGLSWNVLVMECPGLFGNYVLLEDIGSVWKYYEVFVCVILCNLLCFCLKCFSLFLCF